MHAAQLVGKPRILPRSRLVGNCATMLIAGSKLGFADQRQTDDIALKGARARKSMGPAEPSFFK